MGLSGNQDDNLLLGNPVRINDRLLTVFRLDNIVILSGQPGGVFSDQVRFDTEIGRTNIQAPPVSVVGHSQLTPANGKRLRGRFSVDIPLPAGSSFTVGIFEAGTNVNYPILGVVPDYIDSSEVIPFEFEHVVFGPVIVVGFYFITPGAPGVLPNLGAFYLTLQNEE